MQAKLLFAPRLRRRLIWFGHLRWMAVGGLALVSFAGPGLGFPSLWPSFCILAAVVAAYNIVFQRILRRGAGQSFAERELYLITGFEMGMDVAALFVAAHFTGGMESPLLLFFAFHMVIGTIIISSHWAYVLAAATSVGALVLLLVEAQGLVGFHPLLPERSLDFSRGGLNLVTLATALFGIVYLTGSVVSQLVRTTVGLSETADNLQRRREDLQKVVREKEDLERRKSHYMRISAHQLRSPLGTIRTSLQVLTEGYVDPSSVRGKRLLDGAVERTDELLATVNDLLELAKIREGKKRAPWRRDIILNQLLADLIDAMAPAAENREIELIPQFQGVVVLDRGVPPDLIHAFENLIYNAIKYSHPGSQVTVELEAEDGFAVTRVIDHGIGIPEALIDEVFLEFVRAPNAKLYATEGTGLGLAIVREVVEAHGGDAIVENTVGEGTTVRIRLPLQHAPEEGDRSLLAGNESGYHPHTPPPPNRPAAAEKRAGPTPGQSPESPTV